MWKENTNHQHKPDIQTWLECQKKKIEQKTKREKMRATIVVNRETRISLSLSLCVCVVFYCFLSIYLFQKLTLMNYQTH